MSVAERKQREKARRRNNIIDAAENLFASKGFKATTMDDVAAAAELAKGTLYLYFKSKEDLYFAMVLRCLGTIRHRLEDTAQSSQSSLEMLRGFSRSFYEFIKEKPYYAKLLWYTDFSETLINRDTYWQAEAGKVDILAFLANAISRAQQDGSVRDDFSPEELASFLFKFFNASTDWAVDQLDDPFFFNLNKERLYHRSIDLFIDAIRAT